jgi:hypothetical protein
VIGWKEMIRIAADNEIPINSVSVETNEGELTSE